MNTVTKTALCHLVVGVDEVLHLRERKEPHAVMPENTNTGYRTQVVILLAGSLRHPILALVKGRQCTLDSSLQLLCTALKTTHQPYPCHR